MRHKLDSCRVAVFGLCLLLCLGTLTAAAGPPDEDLATQMPRSGHAMSRDQYLQPAAFALPDDADAPKGQGSHGAAALTAQGVIAGSPRFMEAQLGAGEAPVPPEERIRLLAAALAFLIVALGLALALWIRQRHIRALGREVEALENSRQQAELQYEALSQQYLALARAAGVLTLLADTQLKILDADARAAQTFGYSRDELLLMTLRDLLAPEDAQTLATQLLEPCAEAELELEALLRRKDGTLFPAQLGFQAVYMGGSRYHQVIIRDLGERKQAEAERAQLAASIQTAKAEAERLKAALEQQNAHATALEAARQALEEQVNQHRQAEAQLQQDRDAALAIVASASALVTVLDVEGHIVQFNWACEHLTGYSLDEAKGRLAWELLAPADEQEAAKGVLADLLAGKGPLAGEGCWLTRDGRRRHIAWSSTVLVNNSGAPESIVSIGLDITDRRRAEEELQGMLRGQLKELDRKRRAEVQAIQQRLDAEVAGRSAMEGQARRQAAAFQLARRALAGGDLGSLIEESVAVVADGLDVACCQVLELLADGYTMRFRAGALRREGRIERVTAGDASRSAAPGEPVGPLTTELMAVEGGSLCGISVVIQGPAGPFGTLVVHTGVQRVFAQDDIRFLQVAADVLAQAIVRRG